MDQQVAQTRPANADAEVKQYRVRWEIDVEATSAEEAARSARATQLREESIADVFQVHPVDGATVSTEHESVDLSELDGRYADAA